MNKKKKKNVKTKHDEKQKVKRKRRKKKKKGFTLIELLAVIVILGLLMAIAIPSVTRYITESRKKTLTTTVNNYIGALVNEVNDLEYTFTGQNTIYAVPIECISLERGGTNPFGEWYQANDKYFAYVLIQYDDINSKYIYGFTFKDSAGYGLYPTTQANIKEKGSQIKIGYSLTKPKSGKATNIATLDKWNGFLVDATTNLQVLEATSEGDIGNEISTCTLQQKGENYAQVEEEKVQTIKDCTLMAYDGDTVFWEYKDQIKTITFEDTINMPSDAFKLWDVSLTGNGSAMAYIKPNVIDSSYYDLYIQGDGQLYANANSSNLFNGFVNVDSINNIDILNTSNVTNMYNMFYDTGYNSTLFTLDLGDNFDTSNVSNMEGMFFKAGYSSTVFKLDLGERFDTSKVTNMMNIFNRTGYSSTVFTLDLGDKFDTRNVVNMVNMFNNAGRSSPVFTLDLGNKFDTSKVSNMAYMFHSTGYKSKVFTLDLGNKFDTSKVTSMWEMFYFAGYSSPVFTLELGNKFDTSKVTGMYRMFAMTGNASAVFTLDLGDKFNTSNVTNMSGLFWYTGYSNPTFTLKLGDKFDTSNVTNMWQMLAYTGYGSSLFRVDCSNWNVDKVTSYAEFNTGVTSKVTPPKWVN